MARVLGVRLLKVDGVVLLSPAHLEQPPENGEHAEHAEHAVDAGRVRDVVRHGEGGGDEGAGQVAGVVRADRPVTDATTPPGAALTRAAHLLQECDASQRRRT